MVIITKSTSSLSKYISHSCTHANSKYKISTCLLISHPYKYSNKKIIEWKITKPSLIYQRNYPIFSPTNPNFYFIFFTRRKSSSLFISWFLATSYHNPTDNIYLLSYIYRFHAFNILTHPFNILPPPNHCWIAKSSTNTMSNQIMRGRKRCCGSFCFLSSLSACLHFAKTKKRKQQAVWRVHWSVYEKEERIGVRLT